MRYVKCMKYGLILFNGMLVIVSVAAVALGAYILQKEYGILDTTQATGNRFYEVAVYLLFSAASLAVIVGLSGCLAARFENRCLAICHCIFMAAILFLLGMGTGLAFYYRFSILHSVKDKMHKNLVEKYGMDNDDDHFITDFWNFIQRKLACCGLEGNINSTLSWSIYKRESQWFKQFSRGSQYVPTTCCRPDGDDNVCTGVITINGPPSRGPPVTAAMASNPFIYSQGCYQAFTLFMDKYAIILAAVTITILILAVIAMITSLCFCREISRLHRQYSKAPS